MAKVAAAFGYSAEELASVPASANMGLSCGNPTATANLRPGEVVLDLGSGGGLDVFLAAGKVGPTGTAIGIDMTADMIDRARRGAREAGLENVEFYLAEIESLPLPSAHVDCVVSNCVLNLVPDKQRAFAEIYRVLKPGGRLAISDIVLKRPLPEEISTNLLAYIGCVAGAIRIETYRHLLAEAGFRDIMIVDSGADLAAYAAVESQGCCCAGSPETIGLPAAAPAAGDSGQGHAIHDELTELLQRYDVNEFAASVRVFAVKPTA